MFRPRCAMPLIAAFTTLAVAPGLAARQSPGPDVPMDLALALLGSGGPDVALRVGTVPPAADGRIPLGPIERVVGSLERGSQGTIVVEVRGSAGEVPGAYRDLLEARGWTPLPQPASSRGGFQPSDRYRVEIRCGPTHYAQASSMELSGRTYLRIQYGSREGGRNPCDMADTSSQRPSARFLGLSLPELGAPPGAVARPAGGGSSGDAIDSQVGLESDLGVDEIFEHYARQLTAAGWRPEGASVGSDAAVGRWHAQDDDGKPAVGLLVVWRGVTAREVTASVHLERGNPRR